MLVQKVQCIKKKKKSANLKSTKGTAKKAENSPKKNKGACFFPNFVQ